MRRVIRWMVRGVAAALSLTVLAWVVLGARSLVAAALAVLSVAALAFVVAELTGQWPVKNPPTRPTGSDS